MTTFDKVSITSDSQFVYGLNIFNGETAPQHAINVTSEQEYNCKYFSTKETRSAWLEKRNEFIDYVMSFYGEGGIYSDFFSPVLTKNDVILATNAIDKAGGEEINFADSIAREMIRDYLLISQGKLDIEYTIARTWFDKFPPRFHKR